VAQATPHHTGHTFSTSTPNGAAVVGVKTVRKQTETTFIVFGFLESETPDTKTESNIIETENGAKTNRREYGNENLSEYKNPSN
jgi:hypothetical protein